MATAELKQPRAGSKRLDAKQAAKLSLEYFNELFPNADVSNVALEEVEFLDDENSWLITLGFDGVTRSRTTPAISSNKTIAELFGSSSPTRRYKIFRIDAKTGKVASMKIRKLE